MMLTQTSVITALIAIAGGALLTGCGGTTDGRTSPGDAGSGADTSGGSGGSTSGGSGGTTTGGSTSGGSGGSGARPGPTGECTADTDCLAVMNTDDPCYSGDCSAPVWASRGDLGVNDCLVPWDDRYLFDIPPHCGQTDEPVGCPAMCAVQPACVFPACLGGTCGGEMFYDPAECGGVGGSGGFGGGPVDCEQLDTARREALQAAAACDPMINMPQCMQGYSVPDECGCVVPVNDSIDLFEAATSTYEVWADLGCGPLPCGRPCMMGEFAGCAEGPDGTGMCTYVTNGLP